MNINNITGSVLSGLAIADTMGFIKCDVSTVCMGQAASMGAYLLGQGTPGKRMALPGARIMMHQVSAGNRGTYMDMEIAMAETKILNLYLHEELARVTGHTVEQLLSDCSRDKFMSSNEAMAYGLIDKVITKRELM